MSERDLDVVFFRDGDFWTGVCTRFPIFAEGASLEEARATFGKVLRDRLTLCEHFGQSFADLRKDNDRYANLFSQSSKDLGSRTVEQFTLHERTSAF